MRGQMRYPVALTSSMMLTVALSFALVSCGTSSAGVEIKVPAGSPASSTATATDGSSPAETSESKAANQAQTSAPTGGNSLGNRVDSTVLDQATIDLSSSSDEQISAIAATTLNTWVKGRYDKAPNITESMSKAMNEELLSKGISGPKVLIYDPVQRVAVMISGGSTRYNFWAAPKSPFVEDPSAWAKVPAGKTPTMGGIPAEEVEQKMADQGYTLQSCAVYFLVRTGPGKWSAIGDTSRWPTVGKQAPGLFLSVRDLGVKVPAKADQPHGWECAAAG